MAQQTVCYKTQFQMFEVVRRRKRWWERWIQWLFGCWGCEENTGGLEDVTVHCSGDVLVCLCLKMQSALNCLHVISSGWGLVMDTEVLEIVLHRSEMTL